MPLTHISMLAGKPTGHAQAIFDGVYRALRETFDVPEGDQFMALTEHDAAHFRYGSSYLGITRSDDVVFIQITAHNTRNLAQKRALFKRISELLEESPGIRPEDVFVSLVEVSKENWSLGNGIAQYV